MQAMMLPIEMIVTHTREGVPTPIRFRVVLEDEQLQTVDVGQIIERTETVMNKIRRLHYRCRSAFAGLEKEYEITFEVPSMRWHISKM